MENKKTVVLAPHKDGFGAFSIIARLALVLRNLYGSQLRLIFCWGGHTPLTRVLDTFAEFELNKPIVPNTLPNVYCVRTDNLIKIPKDPAGGTVRAWDILPILQNLSLKEDVVIPFGLPDAPILW